MAVFTKRHEISAAVANLKNSGNSVGFVPTMGALHSGHASLIEFALKQVDKVVVSIYVNPTQFNNSGDLDAYPRDLDSDVLFLEPFGEKLIIYAPDSDQVYGENVKSFDYDFGGLENEMEGKFRPGHFEGVGTVLKLLFESVNPDKAFFGEKDFQQLQIVRKLAEIEKLPVEIIGVPIHRAEDGLAESSRNRRLNAAQRAAAPFIYKVLQQVNKDFQHKSIEHINHWVADAFKDQPELELEYFEIADSKTLKTAKKPSKNDNYRAFIAVFAGEIRLIDNIPLI
ncbi:pantoate--beta-alanine ligase [Leeuwenhoekiella sp. A16]|uniref:pantoate--beta-alanine ligase n=1 Tax=unclassified Leeuwenhoekiella TaxID=2615029 RepID=UPI003A804ABF